MTKLDVKRAETGSLLSKKSGLVTEIRNIFLSIKVPVIKQMLAAAHKFVNDEVNFKGVASVIT